MNLTDEQISSFILQYLLPMFRIAAMFMVMPVIGARTVPPRVRMVLAFTICILVVPILPKLPDTPSLSLSTLMFVIQELAIGLICGFMFQIVFQVFVLSGQFMAMKMGLGFASMNDPTNGVQTTILSQFFLMLVTLIFVTVDGHLVLVSVLVESFLVLPPGEWILTRDVFIDVVSLGSWMFAAALVFALPVLTSLLFVNIAFGVMSRAAPQLNIFAVGFPFTLVVGLFLVWVGLTNFSTAFENVMAYGFTTLENMLGL